MLKRRWAEASADNDHCFKPFHHRFAKNGVCHAVRVIIYKNSSMQWLHQNSSTVPKPSRSCRAQGMCFWLVWCKVLRKCLVPTPWRCTKKLHPYIKSYLYFFGGKVSHKSQLIGAATIISINLYMAPASTPPQKSFSDISRFKNHTDFCDRS